MIEHVTKIGSNRDYCHLASNEIEGFSTLTRLSPAEAEYNNSSTQSTITNEDIITSKKRKKT